MKSLSRIAFLQPLKCKIVIAFFLCHLALILFIDEMYAFAPDEPGYIYTFLNLYGSDDPNPQFSSGWLNTPKLFLWLLYSPPKMLTEFGIGAPLAIRIYSIVLITMCFGIAQSLLSKTVTTKTRLKWLPLAVFCVPSVFLWTSLGLREVFLITELFLFFLAIWQASLSYKIQPWLLLFFSSYALFATKNYLWGIVMCALVVTCSYFLLRKMDVKKNILLLVVGLLGPAIYFGASTSLASFDFLTKSNLTLVSERTGDSIFVVSPDSKPGKITPETQEETDSNAGISSKPESVTIRGAMTLVLIRNFYMSNPDSLFTKASQFLGIKSKVFAAYDTELKQNTASKPSSGHSSGEQILKAAKIHEPLTIVSASTNFLFSPLPFMNGLGNVSSVIAFESPIWWAIYILLILYYAYSNKLLLLKNWMFIFSTIFFAGFVVFSGLVEVNLGTSFRHRSIIVIPIFFMMLELLTSRKVVQKFSPD